MSRESRSRAIVLVAESCDAKARVIVGLLETAGVASARAASAEDALRLARESRPHVAVVNAEFDGRRAAHVVALLRDFLPDALVLLFHDPAHPALVLPIHRLSPGTLAIPVLPPDWPETLIDAVASLARAVRVLRGELLGLRGMTACEPHRLPLDFNAWVADYETELITLALEEAGRCKRAAARGLGIHEATLRTKMAKYHIATETPPRRRRGA